MTVLIKSLKNKTSRKKTSRKNICSFKTGSGCYKSLNDQQNGGHWVPTYKPESSSHSSSYYTQKELAEQKYQNLKKEFIKLNPNMDLDGDSQKQRREELLSQNHTTLEIDMMVKLLVTELVFNYEYTKILELFNYYKDDDDNINKLISCFFKKMSKEEWEKVVLAIEYKPRNFLSNEMNDKIWPEVKEIIEYKPFGSHKRSEESLEKARVEALEAALVIEKLDKILNYNQVYFEIIYYINKQETKETIQNKNVIKKILTAIFEIEDFKITKNHHQVFKPSELTEYSFLENKKKYINFDEWTVEDFDDIGYKNLALSHLLLNQSHYYNLDELFKGNLSEITKYMNYKKYLLKFLTDIPSVKVFYETCLSFVENKPYYFKYIKKIYNDISKLVFFNMLEKHKTDNQAIIEIIFYIMYLMTGGYGPTYNEHEHPYLRKTYMEFTPKEKSKFYLDFLFQFVHEPYNIEYIQYSKLKELVKCPEEYENDYVKFVIDTLKDTRILPSKLHLCDEFSKLNGLRLNSDEDLLNNLYGRFININGKIPFKFNTLENLRKHQYNIGSNRYQYSCENKACKTGYSFMSVPPIWYGLPTIWKKKNFLRMLVDDEIDPLKLKEAENMKNQPFDTVFTNLNINMLNLYEDYGFPYEELVEHKQDFIDLQNHIELNRLYIKDTQSFLDTKVYKQNQIDVKKDYVAMFLKKYPKKPIKGAGARLYKLSSKTNMTHNFKNKSKKKCKI